MTEEDNHDTQEEPVKKETSTEQETTGSRFNSFKSTAASKLTQKVSFMGKSLPVWAVLLVFTGGATAVTAAVVFGSISGTGDVGKGLQFKATSVSGNGQVNQDGSFTFNVKQGGKFSFSYAKENLANEKTEPLVEMVVLDGNSTGLSHKTLEEVRFYAKQTTKKSSGSTVQEGTTVNLSMSWNSTGDLVSDQSGAYLDVTSKDIDSDGKKEIVIGVADSNGMVFGPNEHWNAKYTIDTQSSFPQVSNMTVTATLAGKHNPKTGGLSQVAKIIPQYKE